MHSILLDTSFLIRLLNEDDPLFENADGYFRYFLQKEIALNCSTISIAEYCVKGSIYELPLKNIQIIPFNFFHGQRAGEIAKIVFENRNQLKLSSRLIIPNDTKIFAQADYEKAINTYITSDTESIRVYNLIKKYTTLDFTIIDLNNKYTETFGILDLK